MPSTATATAEPGGIAEDLIMWAAKFLGFYTPPPPKKRVKPKKEVMGSAQKQRAKDTYDALSAKDKTKFDKLKKDAKSDTEKGYLDKALASQYSVADVEKFAKKIQGKDEKWMQDNLKLTGDSKGKGVKQQWSHSCNATTVQAIRGELDPIYALKLHEENKDLSDADDSDGAKMNPKLAAEQKKWLESKTDGTGHAGTAKNRNAVTDGTEGRWAKDLMNNISDVTGVEYTNQLIDDSTYTVADAVKDVEKGLKVGHPVPIVVGNSLGSYAHYVLVTGFSADGKSWVIHDPGGGNTAENKVSDIKNNNMSAGGYSRLTALDTPATKKAIKAAKKK